MRVCGGVEASISGEFAAVRSCIPNSDHGTVSRSNKSDGVNRYGRKRSETSSEEDQPDRGNDQDYCDHLRKANAIPDFFGRPRWLSARSAFTGHCFLVQTRGTKACLRCARI